MRQANIYVIVAVPVPFWTRARAATVVERLLRFGRSKSANHITFSYSKYQPHRRVFAGRSSSYRATDVIEHLSFGTGNRF